MSEIVINLIDEIAKRVASANITAQLSQPNGSTSTKPLIIMRGFPRAKAFDLPCLSINAMRAQKANQWAEKLSFSGETATHITAKWRTQRVEVPIMLDLWTHDVTQRLVIVPQLAALFENGLDVPHGMELTIANNANANARLIWLDDEAQDEDDEERGIRRLNIRCVANTEITRTQTLEKASFTAIQTFE